jgi:hypothetical protein
MEPAEVSNSEMSNFLRFFAGLSPTPSGRVPGFRKLKKIKGLRRGVPKYAKTGIPKLDAEIAEKGHLWMETRLNRLWFKSRLSDLATVP